MTRGIPYSFTAMAAALLLATACQQQQQQRPTLDRKTYPDAVVRLSQVDPAYRSAFAAQDGANYSREEQIAAYQKARQTAKGPMPAYHAEIVSKSRGKTTAKGKGKGKATPKGKAGAKKAPAKKPAAKKPAAKKKR